MTKKERLANNAGMILKSVDIEKISLPIGFADYLVNEVFEDMRFLFMHREKGKKHGYCTHCNKEMIIDDKLRHNNVTYCQGCHSQVVCKDSGRGRSGLIKYAEVAVAQNLPLGGTLIRQYNVSFSFTHNYKEVTPNVQTPYFWGYFEPNYYATFQKSWYYYNKCFCHTEHIPSDLKINMTDKRINKNCSLYGFEELTKGCLQYCPINLYEDELHKTGRYRYNLYRFMQFYCEYPTLTEKLCKEGFASLLIERLEHNSTGGINLNAKTVTAALRANKSELKQFKKSGEPSLHMIKSMQFLKKHGIKNNKENLLFCANLYSGQDFSFCMKYATYNEIKKVTNRCPYFVRDYRDYLKECIELDFDMSCKSVVVPRDLQTAHQRTSALIRKKKNKAEAERLKQLGNEFEKTLLPKYTKKYSFQYGDYIIRPAQGCKELQKEGNALNHCVAGYAERYLIGKTIILLIRKKSDPNKPFCTMEVSGNTVIQCRTAHNHTYKEDETIVAFIKQWKARNKNTHKSINVA